MIKLTTALVQSLNRLYLRKDSISRFVPNVVMFVSPFGTD